MEWQNDAEAQEASKCGSLRVERAGGLSAATRVYGTYPVKLMVTEKVAPPGTDCVWVYGVTFGGGLVSGDRAGVSIQVAATCACVLATQAATKACGPRPFAPGLLTCPWHAS